MTPAVLALPNGLFRLQCHLKSLLLPSSTPTLKAFSSSLAFDGEDTPAMKALKDIPYPSASPDPSIFESWSDEYNGVHLPKAVLAQRYTGSVSSPRANQGYHASGVLEQLSRSTKFAEAEQVRQELVEMNVPIRPSSAYYSVGLNILLQRPWPPNRTEMFANWLSLLPGMANDRKPIDFSQMKSALLFNSSRLDLETVAQFGIILSSKGYIRHVGAPVVACLTRYADPDVSSRILDEMIAANDDYNRSELGSTLNASNRKNRTARRLWSIVVRTHCTAGRPEVALQMAKRAHEHGLQLTKYTYEYLLGKLEADGLNDLAAELRALPRCGSLDVAKSRLVEDVFALTSIPPISRKQSKAINQAIVLANLKRSSRSGSQTYAVDIVPYFDIYKTDHRGGEEANQLRASAYRISLTSASTVLLAEQLHHLRRGQFRHVLWVFDKFFHAVGVPSEDVTRLLWKRKHYPPHLHLHHWYLPPRITKTTFNLPSKLWPTPHHTALVWTALVHLCETEEELFSLYNLLLQQSAQFQKSTAGHHHRSSHGSSSISAPVHAPADRFDAAHFRPFLIAFTLLRDDAKHGLRILDDMQDRGIAPSAQFLSTAAALQARRGEPALALRMLDITRGLLERAGDEEVAEASLLETEAGMGAAERAKKQQQLLSAYTGVLRGFVDRRDLVQARRVANLLRGHLGYVEGAGTGGVDGDSGSNGNALTNAALRYLRRLELEGPGAQPEPLAKADDDWRRHHYIYPFLKKRDSEVCPIFPKKIVAFSILPHRSLFFSPWGKATCYAFYIRDSRSCL